MGRVHLQDLPGKSGAPGARENVSVGSLCIIAAFQEKRLFVNAICKVSLGPAMEWHNTACRGNYVQSSDPQTGMLGVEGTPVFVIV